MVYEFLTKDGYRLSLQADDILGIVERKGEVGILTRSNCWFVNHSYDQLHLFLYRKVESRCVTREEQ